MIKYDMEKIKEFIWDNLELNQENINELHLLMGTGSSNNKYAREKLINDDFLNNLYSHLCTHITKENI
jgi:hypothetical protein